MNDSPNQDVVVFTEALRLRPAERRMYLDKACAGKDELRARVESLLKAHEKAGNFLADPPTGIPVEDSPANAVGERTGDRIGRYKLLQQIGEGGCGVVYMAEQQEPVHRRVALKIVKPGLDTKNVIARFEAERQALALMDHPNIAQVFDAGATDGGRPYFVMELVRGTKITEFCDQNSLTTRARLDLFVQVCGAIQHAHQKGIIHRDIKPSNILVTTTADGKPLPKVIDFGIAKATTGQRLTDKTLFTAFEMLIGTPAYMSPEQAALTNVDVDTRSDIYSLGVLLYELLTSTTPFDTGELLKAGLDEVRRVIREQEPARPSTRLSTMIAADLTNVSLHRRAEPPKLIRDVRGDLDWIVMKAMEKDRARRYPTANGLALDIERYLDGDVVLARPPSALYKARKLIARNKLLFSGFAIVFLLLAAGFAITGRLLMVEKQAHERVQHENEVLRLESSGVSLVAQKRFSEAESDFRKALDIRRQCLGSEPPNPMVVDIYVRLLRQQGKINEEDTFLAEFLGPGRLAQPEFMELTSLYVGDLAARGRWKEAATNAAALVKNQADFSGNYHLLAPLLVASHDEPGYRQICQQIISRFKDTQDPFIADPMAKDCLILPFSGADLESAGAMADIAVSKGKGHPSYPLFECCKALAEYRQEHFAAAMEWAERAVKDPFPFSKAEGYAILAMAQHKSGGTNEARVALASCNKIIEEKFPKLSSGNLGGDWRDWIIAHTLRDEAARLIGGDSASGTNSPPK
jgi:serine/threonine protein kinase